MARKKKPSGVNNENTVTSLLLARRIHRGNTTKKPFKPHHRPPRQHNPTILVVSRS